MAWVVWVAWVAWVEWGAAGGGCDGDESDGGENGGDAAGDVRHRRAAPTSDSAGGVAGRPSAAADSVVERGELLEVELVEGETLGDVPPCSAGSSLRLRGSLSGGERCACFLPAQPTPPTRHRSCTFMSQRHACMCACMGCMCTAWGACALHACAFDHSLAPSQQPPTAPTAPPPRALPTPSAPTHSPPPSHPL